LSNTFVGLSYQSMACAASAQKPYGSRCQRAYISGYLLAVAVIGVLLGHLYGDCVLPGMCKQGWQMAAASALIRRKLPRHGVIARAGGRSSKHRDQSVGS
jgi:hypothetical protein